MGSDNLYIGIDSGTQGTKAVVLSEKTGKVLAESYASYSLIENERGGREQDPAVWLAAVKAVVVKVLNSEHVDPSHIRGVGVSGQQHGMVVLDKSGAVIRPAKLWCDTETEEQCRKIIAKVGGAEAMVSQTGNSLAVGFTGSKLLWLKENEPAHFEKIDTVLLPHDYINYWLTGEKVAEFGDASGTGYFDVQKRSWSESVIDAVDESGVLKNALPRLIEADSICGTVRADIACELGLPSGVIVSSGGGDNMMAAIGSGNVKPGVVTTSLGTSGTIYGYSDTPVVDPKGELAAFCSSSGGWLPLVCTMNVTVATELTRKLLGVGLDDMTAMIASSPAGAEGLLLLPYFQGERTPALPLATATLGGMTSANYTPSNLARCAMEGATYGLRYGLEVMVRNGCASEEIRLTGGGAKSSVWRQMVADVFKRPVVTLESEEAGALGAAIQAVWAYRSRLEGKSSLVELVSQFVAIDSDTLCEPGPAVAQQYDELYERYVQFNSKMYG